MSDQAAPRPTAAEATRLLSTETGRRYELVRRLAGGETGAHEVAGPDGERLVLKWEGDLRAQGQRREGVRMADRLRTEAAWPVPRQRLVESPDWLFILQDLLPGAPVAALTPGLVEDVIALHERRLAMSAPGRLSWPSGLLKTLTIGRPGYCSHDVVRSHDGRTSAFVTAVEAFGASVDPAELLGGSVIHWDLHWGNLLQLDGRLSAVVDTDFCQPGDARFDLVALAFSSADVAHGRTEGERLKRIALDGLSDVARLAYVGHLLLRMLHWSILRERPGAVDLWLARGREFGWDLSP